MRYRIFNRHWWRENPDWPNGLEPDAGPKRTICYVDTIEQARETCRRFNAESDPGRYGMKCEFEVSP